MKHNRKVRVSADLKPQLHHVYEANLVRKIVKDKKLLDVGCWSGQFLSLLEDEYETYGLDLSKDAINFAKKNRKGKYFVGSALKLPFKKGSFDIVTMWDVIEHLPPNSEDRSILEINRVLKKKGYICICTMTDHPLSIMLDPAYFLIGHRHYSKNFLVNLLEKHGFKIKSIQYTGGIWTLINDNLNLFKKHILRLPTDNPVLENLIKKEYKDKGFVEIHIIAQKN